MMFADSRLRRPTVISLITAVFVCCGLCAVAAGGDYGRKTAAFGKAGLAQVTKDLPNPGGPSPLEDGATGENCGPELTGPPCPALAGSVAGITIRLPRMTDGAVRGRAPPAEPLA